MAEELQAKTWPRLFRRFLTLRREEDLSAAVSRAPAQVAEFLTICRGADIDGANALIEALRERIPLEDEERVTVELGYCDVFARLCLVFHHFPLESQGEALEVGLNGCQEAIRIACAIEDLPCAGFYLTLVASGFKASAQPERAVGAYHTAEGIYRQLNDEGPGIYLQDLASTLNNMGNLLRDLRALEQAREVFDEASTIYRRLAGESPEANLSSLAASLSNLGNALRDLRELEQASAAFEEAMGIYRHLAAEQPEIYESVLATAVNNLGALLCDLRELEQSRAAFEEALAIRRRLAEGSPELYLPDLSATLNNLGNVLADLRKLEPARAAYEEALGIRRRLAGRRPEIFLPDLATTLNNLGNLQRDVRQPEAARTAHEEALGIRRRLAAERPEAFLPDLAMTLNNLGTTLCDLRELNLAATSYDEALSILGGLADERPEVYLPDLAGTLNNLGNLQRRLRELEQARAAFEGARAVYKRLATERPGVFLPNLAAAANNLANLLSDLQETEQEREACEEALNIYARLAEEQPDTFLPDLASTLNNRGALLCSLGQWEEARADFDSALEIRRRLAEERPEVYLPNVTTTLNNLGNLFRELGEVKEARAAYEEALSIQRRFAEKQPEVYLPDVALTLNNLGLLFRDPQELEWARSVLRESAELYAGAESHIDAALPCANRARAEREMGDRAFAMEWAEKALEFLETGLAQLSTAEHYDKFKVRIERAVEVLVEQYADELPQASDKLLRLFEWLRRAEATADLHRLADVARPRLPNGLRHPVLWIQRVRRSLVFVVLRPGEALRVYQEKKEINDRGWADRIENLLVWMDEGSEALAVADAAESLFSLFPQEIRDLLTQEGGGPVFVSPCRQTLALPLELIPARSGSTERLFAGLRRPIMRFHSLGELNAVLERQPTLDGVLAVVIGEPETESAPLPAAREGAEYVADLLRVEACLGKDATHEFVMTALSNPGLAAFIFTGHGWPDALALAGDKFLTVDDLRGLQWQGAPFVHLDCCYTGSVRGAGGGRFLGMPSAMVRCGASVVLASYHPLYDEMAKAFSCRLYDLMVQQKLPLGEALLETRQWMHREFYGIPLFWATSVLWGNPDVRLVGE